jgi:hypothetical protein
MTKIELPTTSKEELIGELADLTELVETLKQTPLYPTKILPKHGNAKTLKPVS